MSWLVGLLLIVLFGYLWVQLVFHVFGEVNTVNLIYALVGIVIVCVAIYSSYTGHDFAADSLAIWSAGLIFIVLNYYLWTI